MFFSIAWRNAKRSRSENLIYFLTMVTAIATFYIVLSLGEQDVMRFLSELESDAVDRLLTKLLPTVYLCALLFVFSLVIFANKYQLECNALNSWRTTRTNETLYQPTGAMVFPSPHAAGVFEWDGWSLCNATLSA